MGEDGVGVTAEHRVLVVVEDRAVVLDVEHLVAGVGLADLGDEDLDLQRLHLLRVKI